MRHAVAANYGMNKKFDWQTATERLFKVNEVAAQIQQHPGSVRRAIRQGRIKAIRFGQTWRISPEELRRLMTEGLPA